MHQCTPNVPNQCKHSFVSLLVYLQSNWYATNSNSEGVQPTTTEFFKNGFNIGNNTTFSLFIFSRKGKQNFFCSIHFLYSDIFFLHRFSFPTVQWFTADVYEFVACYFNGSTCFGPQRKIIGCMLLKLLIASKWLYI